MGRGPFQYLMFILLAVSCSAPSQMEDFRPVDERDSLGRFVYSIDMSDSLSVYDILFYTRVDCPDKLFAELQNIKVDVGLLSPSGISYEETVYIPITSFTSDRKGTYDCQVEYRKGLVPVEWGTWRMYIVLPELKGMHGMGVINRKR